MKEIDRIITEIKKHKAELADEFHVKELGVFGSFIRGEERIDSDIDILVDFDKTIDLFRLLDLEERLSEVSGKKVDLVSKNALKTHIGKKILEEVQYL